MNIDIEDAMKIIISAGLVQPTANNPMVNLADKEKEKLEDKSEEVKNIEAKEVA